MKLTRLPLILGPLIIVIGLSWLLWSWPRRVDMAQYAPADSLVYLECNNLAQVVESITTTDAWREFGSKWGVRPGRPGDRWLAFPASLGIAPAQSVILARAQVAVVMLNLDATEENTTLRIKPEGAVIIETHTSAWRIKPPVEAALQSFVEKTYGQVTPRRYREDVDYLEWKAPTGDRRIVAAIDQSLVVVGNSKRAVQTCLEARRGQRPNLRNDPALQQMRTRVGAPQALTFGYVSSGNATRLFSWGAPILLGRGPGDSTLEQIITKSAAKVLGAVGWSSHASTGGIEDRFFFALEPSVVSRLRPAFKVGSTAGSFWRVVPSEVDSVTIYRAETPVRAWEALGAVSAQFDALSAVVFGSVLRAALLPYGIENPAKFLKAVGPEVATVKLQRGADGSVFIARSLDQVAIEQIFRARAKQDPKSGVFDFQLPDVTGKRFAATFVDGYVVIGAPDDVRICLDARRNRQTIMDENRLAHMTTFAPGSSASIVTYTNDAERVHNFFSLMTALKGSSQPATSLPTGEEKLPYATTETNLADQGIERRTRSAFGQFSTLIRLLRQD